MPRQHPPQITRREHLHQAARIRAAQFHLPFTGHIPDLHVLFQVVVIRLHTVKHRWQQHAVVNRVGFDTRRFHPFRKRGAAQSAGWRNQRHQASSSIRNRSDKGAPDPAAVGMACTWPRWWVWWLQKRANSRLMGSSISAQACPKSNRTMRGEARGFSPNAKHQ